MMTRTATKRRAPVKPAPRPVPKPDTARKVHVLKCWPESFEAILSGSKTGEIRVNDRDYQPGCDIIMREFVPVFPQKFTGRELRVSVGKVLAQSYVSAQCGLNSGGVEMFVLMSIKLYPDSLRSE